MRQLASPTMFQLSRLVPSSSVTQPESDFESEFIPEQADKATKASAIKPKRFMVLLLREGCGLASIAELERHRSGRVIECRFPGIRHRRCHHGQSQAQDPSQSEVQVLSQVEIRRQNLAQEALP